MVLEERDEPFEHAFFPNTGITSIMAITQTGDRVEAGLFGREGMSGMPILPGDGRQTAYTTLANVAHPVEVRLARWLLQGASDREEPAHDRATPTRSCHGHRAFS